MTVVVSPASASRSAAAPSAVGAPSRSSSLATALLLAPRNACVAILDAYRAVVSPLYGDVCRYYPSCSRYALTAIQQHGVIRGVWLGSRRLARCHPWTKGGIDDVPAHPRTHAVLGRGGFVLAVDPHADGVTGDYCHHCDPAAPAVVDDPIEGAGTRA